MSDLYSVLGVEEDADDTIIRQAYRKRAKSAHPDTGGSAEKFRELSNAYEVLSNPDRRRKYDETGSTEEAQDHTEAAAIQILDNLVSSMAADADAKFTDPVRIMRDTLNAAQKKLEGDIPALQREELRLLDLEARFLKKPAKDIVGQLLRRRIEAKHGEIDMSHRQIAAVKRAVEMLEGYEFKTEERPVEHRTITGGVDWGAYEAMRGFGQTRRGPFGI